MSRLIPLLIVATGLAACGPRVTAPLPAPSEPAPQVAAGPGDGSDLRLGGGYRGADDPCVRVGQSDFTAPMLREDADLVGCPIDFDKRPAFQRGTNAREVGRTAAWVLYSVPLLSADAPVADG